MLEGTGGPADWFTWPVGVPSVDLGFREPMTNPGTNNTAGDDGSGQKPFDVARPKL